MIFRRRQRLPPLFVEGETYLAPFRLSMVEVRMLPFLPRNLSTHDPLQVEGVVTMPDGTSATGVVPLNTLRRAP